MRQPTLHMLDTRYPGSDTIQQTELPNGITLLVYENFASQSVVLDGVVRAGAIVEPKTHIGLADFTAMLLMRGTEKRPFDQIYEDMESAGAGLGFGGGRHAMQFSGGGLAEDLALILDLLAQGVRCPTFPEQHVEQVRGQILTGLQMRANDTGQMAHLTFRETLYGDHVYGRSARGYTQTINAITRQDIINFHNRYYGPKGMILTIVGAVRADEVLEKVTAVLGDWCNPNQHSMPDISKAVRPSKLTHTRTNLLDKSQCDIVMGLPGPLRNASDYLDASLMNTIFGVFGMMGRIGQTVREDQGLAYSIYSQLHGGLGPNPWLVSMGVAPDKVDQAVDSVRQEIRRIQDEAVPADELADSQAYRTGSLPVSLETNNSLASVIGDMAYYNLGLDYLQRYPERIRAITPDRIQASAQKYLSADQLVVAVAGPGQ